MNFLRAVIIAFFIGGVASCAITLNGLRLTPQFKGIDSKADPYVQWWLMLAKDHGLKFDGMVTVGFNTIRDNKIVAQCQYGDGFREITIDPTYWSHFTRVSRMTTIFHELGHCLCNRVHDYGNGTEYGKGDESKKDPARKDGFFSDGCPISVMYPIIVEDRCFLSHYTDYVNEIFQRCNPY